MTPLRQATTAMRLLTAILFSWLAILPMAHAASVEIPVPANGQTSGAYAFTISTKAVADDLAFHITITNRVGDIPTSSEAYVGIVTHSDKKGRSTTIGHCDPPISVALNCQPRIWTVDFTVSTKILKQPGLNFIFVEFAHTTINGKTVFMPSADFYELKLSE